MKNMKTMLSSEKMDWETPKEFFEELNKEFNFTLDPCATKDNAKCRKYYTVKENGLIQDWSNESVFVNPPYGCEIKKWVKKCYEERDKAKVVVMLIPARTDTLYFHEYIYHKAEIRFIKGRIKFIGNQKGSGSAPFPSMIVIFKKRLKKEVKMVKFSFEIQGLTKVEIEASDRFVARSMLISTLEDYAEQLISNCLVSEGKELKKEDDLE